MSLAVDPRKRIVLVTSLLGGGGAERVMMTMARWWQAQGREVVILVLRSESGLSEYAVPPGVALRRLNLIGERNAWWRPAQITRLGRLRRAVVELRPALVVSFIDKLNVAVLLALSGTGIPVVATEHLAPWMNPLGAFWESLRRWTYRRAAVVVSPTHGITEWLQARMAGKFVTLPYPAQLEIRPRENRPRRNVIVGVGRLVPQKGFDVLIEAFARIAVKHPDWRVEILGEGPERPALEDQIRRSGLGERLRLLGQIEDVAERLAEAEIFVMPSRHEAFPMALCEAMAAGCAVIASDCPTGPREILSEASGVLVPVADAGRLAQSLENLMADPARRASLGRAAAERAVEFTPEKIMPQWAALVARVAPITP